MGTRRYNLLYLSVFLIPWIGVYCMVPDVRPVDDRIVHPDLDVDPAEHIPEAPVRRNYSSVNVHHVVYGGISPADLTLDERIELEKYIWHWYPYRRINYEVLEDGSRVELSCDEGSAIDELPDDIFTQEQRLQGAIILHFIGAIYFFTILAYIVSEYFLPSVECICEDLKLTQDVAAATFMAIAGSIPEFFTNTISTFIADSDMGLGTVLGSLLFNTLGVAALAGLATRKPVQLDWWPLTRDSIVFSIHVGLLIAFAWDGRIYWYEAMVFVILLAVYFLIMFQNRRIMNFAKKYIEVKWNLCARVVREIEATEKAEAEAAAQAEKEGSGVKSITTTPRRTLEKPGTRMSTASILSDQMAETPLKAGELHIPSRHVIPESEEYPNMTLWKVSKETWLRGFWWFYSWPIRLVLTFMIPNPATMRRWYPLTFVMCIILIGCCSFFTFWMMSIIGYTLGIPDTVMGLTFLAFGGCMPEAISAVIVIRTGSGAMGVSNAMGANSLAILFSLGLPWFIRTVVDGASTTNAYYVIASYGMQYSIISLLFAIAFLYVVIYVAKFKLRKRVGLALFFGYGILVTFMLLNELDIFFPSGDEC
ncbi:sodium/potassium/calcium exchanger 3-like [Topomyia yanbarensis]|uniref:sodium/potassium/calcium exchanger 3-like n=1 Tax=Topomyia yanbarensis TaxID=2498891 RepID=UPI00273B71E8|nr:sodium/potassium/calcium exchanger 3-like [Topomyia yanbarensis]XP_058840664.1 sodium/potassium/calcium exchanger 3-like [Topomyia yanbarensis]